jgi:transposase
MRGLYLAVMDLWKPFRKAAGEPAPGARILFDKLPTWGTRWTQCARANTPGSRTRTASLSKARNTRGWPTPPISRWEGRRSLAKRIQANQRWNIAYLLQESFGQLWHDQREAWARGFFANGKPALKWQRLQPAEPFARMIDRHWAGIAADGHPQNKVPLGFVEGLNPKIRVLPRRADGLRDEEYLRLKSLTGRLPQIGTEAPRENRRRRNEPATAGRRGPRREARLPASFRSVS